MKRLRTIREDLLNLPHDNKAASGPDIIRKKDPTSKTIQHTKALARKAQNPDQKWRATALAGKQYEPNRTKTRHPATPRQRITGPNETGTVTGGNVREEFTKDPTFRTAKNFKKWMNVAKKDRLAREKKEQKSIKEDAANTSQEGDFVPAESNKDFTEKLKQMVYDEAIRETPMKKTTRQLHEAKKAPTIHTDYSKWIAAAREKGHDLVHSHLGSHAYGGEHKTRLVGFFDGKKGWLHEGRESEYTANRHLSTSSSKGRKAGHYLMRHGVALHNEPHATSQQALSAYHNLSDKSNVKIQHVKENYLAHSGLDERDPLVTVYDHTRSASKDYGHPHPIVGHMNLSTAAHIHQFDHRNALSNLVRRGEYRTAKHLIKVSQHQKVPVHEGYSQHQVGDQVRVDANEHPRHGQEGHIQHIDNHGGHYVGFNDGHQEPFQQGEIQKIASRASAVGAISAAGSTAESYDPLVTPGGHANHREYGARGYIHPDRAKYHKLGHHVDFYEHGTGDKKYGMITHNNGKTIHIKPISSIPYDNRRVGKRQIFKVGHPGTPLKEEHERVKVHSPGHYLHGQVGFVHHKLPDGSVKMAIPNWGRRGHKAHLHLKPGEYKPVNEEAVAMSAGAAGDPGHVQNATDNYAFQIDQFGKKKLKTMLRRKKPVDIGTRAGLKP